MSRRLIPQLELGHYFVIRHSCFVIQIVRVYSRDSGKFSPPSFTFVFIRG